MVIRIIYWAVLILVAIAVALLIDFIFWIISLPFLLIGLPFRLLTNRKKLKIDRET